MSKRMSKLYKTPSFGTVFFDSDIGHKPSQDGTIGGVGGVEIRDVDSEAPAPVAAPEGIPESLITDVIELPDSSTPDSTVSVAE